MSMLTHRNPANAPRPVPASFALVRAAGEVWSVMHILNLHAGAPPGAEGG